MGAYVRTEWELFTYDVLGNASDGFEVNDRSCINRRYSINCPVTVNNAGMPREFRSASPTDKQIRKAFGIRCRFTTGGDDRHITIERERDGYPIGEMYCISHNSLSPVRIDCPHDSLLLRTTDADGKPERHSLHCVDCGQTQYVQAPTGYFLRPTVFSEPK